MTNWTDIHEDFGKDNYGKTYQQKWERENLTYQDAQEWIPLGFKPSDYWKVINWKNHNLTTREAKPWIEKGLDKWNDYNFASWLKQKNIQPTNLTKTIEELGNEYQDWIKIAQNYLNFHYPNKQQTKEIKTYSSANLHGSLTIADYPNLEKIHIYGQK